jgi:hypothetical protein
MCLWFVGDLMQKNVVQVWLDFCVLLLYKYITHLKVAKTKNITKFKKDSRESISEGEINATNIFLRTLE